MSAAQDEMDRRAREHYRKETIKLGLENQQLRDQFAFASREVHPFERNCLMGLHKLGLPFHGVHSGWDDKRRRPKTILICHDCWLQRHAPLDPAVKEAIDATP